MQNVDDLNKKVFDCLKNLLASGFVSTLGIFLYVTGSQGNEPILVIVGVVMFLASLFLFVLALHPVLKSIKPENRSSLEKLRLAIGQYACIAVLSLVFGAVVGKGIALIG